MQFDFISPIVLLENEKIKLIFHLSLISSFAWTLYNFYYISKKNNNAVVKINKQNRIIKNTLKQKEILLQEVHHRVKNNLQIVVSLINLQSTKIENEDIKVIFNENARRIRSIASVHELLYSTKDFANVSAKDYVEQLIEAIKASQSNPNLSAIINHEIKDIKISLDKAIPLGLIVNEIITNSIKHSAIQNKVQINVNLQKNENKIEVEAHDNGKGFDYEKELNNDKSIGLFLITELTNQIDGVLSYDIGERGTKYKISFKN